MIQGIGGEENVSFKHLTVHIASLLNFSPLNLKHRRYHAYALILIQQSACLNVSAHPFVKCIRHYYIEELWVKSSPHLVGEKTHWFFSEIHWCEFQYTILLLHMSVWNFHLCVRQEWLIHSIMSNFNEFANNTSFKILTCIF